VSTGDISVGLQTAGTPLAVRVRGIMAVGGYVDDETTNAIVAERLTATDCRDGFLLDGYPRTLGQVDTLDEILSTTGHRVDAVICLQAGEDELVVVAEAGGAITALDMAESQPDNADVES
jgi:adenylate kinase